MSHYCPLDKSYRDVCFAMAHDSHTATQNYSDRDDVPENVDQTRPVDEQLADGIRAVRISNGQVASFLPVIVQHGSPFWEFIGIDTVFGHLEDYLKKIKAFLLKKEHDRFVNHQEVVTIIDEGDADVDAVAAVYQDVFGDWLFKPDMLAIRQNNWPTLGEILSKGQKVVVFMSSYGEQPRYPWIIPAYGPDGFIAMNRYDAYVPDDPDSRPAVDDAFFQSDRWPYPTEIFKLFMLNHQFCRQLVGRTESFRAYNKWTVGDLLVENTIRSNMRQGAFPNFLNVDFYQGVMGAHSYVLDLALAVTACGNAEPLKLFETLDSQASGVFLQDTISSAHPRGLHMGRTYQLISVPTVGGDRTQLAVSAMWQADKSIWTVTLQPAAATDKSQQWRLLYNAPSAGVALVNEAQEFYLFCTDEIGDAATLANDTRAFTGNGKEGTGWEINTYHSGASTYWIRHTYNSERRSDRHLEVRGDACNEGDPLAIYSWQNGDANQLFFFNEVTR